MQKARLLTRPEDYEKIGVRPGVIEQWEDARRTRDSMGEYEWWYFDAIMEDGTKVVVNFNSSMDEEMRAVVEANIKEPSARKNGELRFLRVRITLPDGVTNHETFLSFGSDETEFSKEKCDVRFGSHSFTGNLKEYTIKVEPVHGTGVNLKLTSLTQPWRPGTGYFTFGEDEGHYFTWLCAVPKGEVTGTITYQGKPVEVQGYGYHDHQWANIAHITLWNNWLWARQDLGDYNIVLFDFVAAAEYEYERFPLVFVEDKEGNILFESFEKKHVKCEILEEYVERKTSKTFPKISKYVFENDGKKLEYTLTEENEIEVSDGYTNAPLPMKKKYDELNLQPSYIRYAATGKFVFSHGNQTIARSSILIYEFVHLGRVYKA